MTRLILAALALAAAPASASAASIEVTTDQVIAYEARTGELNALEMVGTVDGGSDLRMAFFEYAARLSAGPGCVAGFPVLCGAVDRAFPVEVSLGDRGDVANVNSLTDVLALDAGSGDDDVLAGGIDATADGGSGNDTVLVAANNEARGEGGAGRDRLAGGLGAAAAILGGGGGPDLVVPDGAISNDGVGAGGDDQVVALRGFDVRLAGGDGQDQLVVVAAQGPVRLAGGDDNDFLSSHAGGGTVDAGPGNDVADLQGGAATAPDTVICGSGWDVVWLDEADTAAADCERVRRGTAPAFRKAAAAEAAARALLAHRPDPSSR